MENLMHPSGDSDICTKPASLLSLMQIVTKDSG